MAQHRLGDQARGWPANRQAHRVCIQGPEHAGNALCQCRMDSRPFQRRLCGGRADSVVEIGDIADHRLCMRAGELKRPLGEGTPATLWVKYAGALVGRHETKRVNHLPRARGSGRLDGGPGQNDERQQINVPYRVYLRS